MEKKVNKGTVIIGAGPAGVSVAESLIDYDYKGKITMLSKEAFPPYSPPLMGNFLENKGTSDLIFWKGRNFCKDHGIQYSMSGEVISIEPKLNKVIIRNGDFIEYDFLVIASGSQMWIPITCEYGKDGTEKYYNFKSLTAVNHLLERVQKGAKKAVVIGSGFIGIEIAITLRRMGLPVTVVEMQNRILPRMIDKKLSEVLEEKVNAMGIELFLNSKGELLRGNERAEELILSDKRHIEADFFIAATGIKPNVNFLEGSNIKIGRGISVNEYLQTNFDNVFAGGDVVETPDLITGNIYPHAIYPEAVKQGKIIAANIMGMHIKYEGGLNMNSLYHFDLPLISEGAMMSEEKADEEIYFESKDLMRRIDIKNNKILRFQLTGSKKGSGLLHKLMVLRKDISKVKNELATCEYNQAKHYTDSLRKDN